MLNRLLLRLLRKLRILKRITVFPSLVVNGRKFRIPIINETGIAMYLSLSEAWMIHLLQQLTTHDSLVMDVGVNIGQTLIKVKAVDPSIRYIGFEPNPLCISYLNELVRINKFEQVEIYPVGIGPESTVMKLNLFSDDTTDSGATLVDGFRSKGSGKGSIPVPVYRYNDLDVQPGTNVRVIKIDVEGAELEVLRELTELIRRDRPFILLEVLPVYSNENEFRLNRQNQIQEWIRQVDYTIFRIIKRGDNLDRIDQLDSFGVHSDVNLCDYVLSPTEQSDNLVNVRQPAP